MDTHDGLLYASSNFSGYENNWPNLLAITLIKTSSPSGAESKLLEDLARNKLLLTNLQRDITTLIFHDNHENNMPGSTSCYNNSQRFGLIGVKTIGWVRQETSSATLQWEISLNM